MSSPCFRTKNIIVYIYFLCEKKGFGLHVIYITYRQTFKFKILGSQITRSTLFVITKVKLHSQNDN